MANGWFQTVGSRLTRTTSGGRYIREIDGLRFVAIFTVIYQHLQRTLEIQAGPGNAPRGWFSNGVEEWRAGVELFFVVSGFVLALPFAAHHLAGGDRVSLKQYFVRRFTRLEPPYLLMLGLFYFCKTAYHHLGYAALLPHLFYSVIYLHCLRYGVGSDINAVNWSLEVEVQFYILAPLLASVFLIRHKWMRRAVLVLAIVVIAELHGALMSRFHLPYTVFASMGNFLAGFLVADIFLVDWNRQPVSRRVWDLLAIPGWLVVLPLYSVLKTVPGTHVPVPRVLLPLLFAGLICVAFKSVFVRSFLRLRGVAIVGGMCYTIYLLHFPPMRVLARFLPVPHLPGGLSAATLLYLIPCCLFLAIFCVPYFLLVERPCMQKDWPQRLWGWAVGRPIPPATTTALPGSIESVIHVPQTETSPLAVNQPLP